MAEISANYAPPALRHALLLEDHPQASTEFKYLKGDDPLIAPLLAPFVQDLFYCVAIVKFPDGRPDAIGYRSVPPGLKKPNAPGGIHTDLSDAWDTLCTKALGRALKRGGYPADLPSLKALVVWRQRIKELEAIGAGTAQIQLTQSDVNAALTAAGSSSPDADTEESGDPVDDGVLEVESEEDVSGPPTPALLNEWATVRKDVSNAEKGHELTAWARDMGIKLARPATTNQARQAIAKAREILGAPASPETPPTSSPGTVSAEVVADLRADMAKLDEDENRSLLAHLDSLGLTLESIDLWPADKAEGVQVWLGLAS